MSNKWDKIYFPKQDIDLQREIKQFSSDNKTLAFLQTRVSVLIKLIASLVQERNTTRTDLLYVFRTTYQVKR